MNNLDEMEEMTNVLLENRYDLHENQNTKKNNNNKKTKKKKGFKHKLKILAIYINKTINNIIIIYGYIIKIHKKFSN